MKLTDVCSKLYKRSTTHFPNLEYYKYDYYRTPVLKDKVIGKGDKTKRAVCVEEMLLMLACLKESDYDQGPCTQLIDTFNKCVRVTEEERRVKKDMRKSGFTLSSELSEPVNRLSSQQVTKLLRRFPEPQ
ncbi:hypothetical protein MN116_007776 [Schistosoma mekongi]|uniref:Coiled-coil-helix-coiled-coil-helix domain-containing protein 1 n=1 Tax=Schistosoma mekongi TaxID=38744 RepID=A0AAE1Z7J3_SCHME|nr:hypothetical protein MN116_007776 [Schistosoma mekongi]